MFHSYPSLLYLIPALFYLFCVMIPTYEVLVNFMIVLEMMKQCAGCPERSEGYKSVPVELLRGVCVLHGACEQKVLILHIFNQLFLQVGARLGCQTLGRHGACRVLPRRGQLVLVLWQVRA